MGVRSTSFILGLWTKISGRHFTSFLVDHKISTLIRFCRLCESFTKKKNLKLILYLTEMAVRSLKRVATDVKFGILLT